MINAKLLGSLMLFTVIFASETAYADRPYRHGGHARVGIGFYFGVPYSYPYYAYPYPYYPYPYYPPVVVTPAQPPVYVEQAPSTNQQATPDNYYWYYCEKSDGYYPYIKECPSGWQKVSPTPPPQP